MATSIVESNLVVQGNLAVSGTFNGVTRSSITQTELAEYPIALTDFRVWDAFQTVLPGTSATDDLGLYGGTWATNSAAIKTYDVKTVGATALYARAMAALPIEYDAGQSVKFIIHASMQTAVADTTCFLDLECYKSDEEGGISSDLCATAQQSMNSLTGADYSFTLTTTNLTPGDVLDFRIKIAPTDAAGASAVIGRIGSVKLACDVRG